MDRSRAVAVPAGPFDLVLCRSLAYSYFDEPTQRAVTTSMRSVPRTGGVLVVGHDGRLPDGVHDVAASAHRIHVALA